MSSGGSNSFINQGGTYGALGKFNLGNLSGANDQARLAQQMAMAEQAKREAMTVEARAAHDRLNLAAQSPQQLAALDRGYSAAQTQVDTDLRQLAAIDPAIMEASHQVLKLLQGGQAEVNGPAMQQRQSQRQQLVDSLRSQYGPGAESSSIGQRALQQFDMQSNTMFQQNQMNTMGNLFDMAKTRVNGPGFGQMMNVAGGYGDVASRMANAEQVGSAGILNAMGNEVQGAGAPFVQDMMKAGFRRQKYEQVSSDMRQMGRTWGTMGAGSKGGSGGNARPPNSWMRRAPSSW